MCFCSMLLMRARGLALRLGVYLLGLSAVICAATSIPTIASVCNITPLGDCTRCSLSGLLSAADGEAWSGGYVCVLGWCSGFGTS